MAARGPKPGEYGAGRSVVLPVRVSPREHLIYKALAQAEGMKLSTWIRAQCERARKAALRKERR